MYNDIVCFNLNLRLDNDNLRLIFLLINIMEIYISKS